MEDYPAGYVTIARPLIVLSGLQDEPSSAQLPNPLNNGPATPPGQPVEAERAKEVLKAFMAFDAGSSQSETSPEHPSRNVQSMKFHLISSGRRYVFPCRKASPPPSQMSISTVNQGTTAHSPALHSPLSPLSPGSLLFPDGCMTPLWLLKYLNALPSVFVSFFSIGDDKSNNTLNDNRLKSEINEIKSSLNDCNFKGKHAVVMIGDQSLAKETNLEDRLSNIRKACKLDLRVTFFFLPPGAKIGDVSFFADSVLQALKPASVDFYKTQHKHARRKKDRRSIPNSPTMENAPKGLLYAGWNARYAFKMGFFSEIRLEMDAAGRAYEEALDCLIGTEGLFLETLNLSLRWNDTRVFADAIAIRRARCLVADGLPTAAASFWNLYRQRTRDIADTVGKGSSTYGWQCWEARWCKIMGQIIEESPSISTDLNARKAMEPVLSKRQLAYAPPEKAATNEDKYLPWSKYLHHPGYWYSLSGTHQLLRELLVRDIPDDDRRPPGQSPATAVARVHKEYDVYMCPEPHVEANQVGHSKENVDALQLSEAAFKEREQHNSVLQLQLRIATELTNESSTEAMSTLMDLWAKSTPLRKTMWQLVSENITLSLHRAAVQTHSKRLMIMTLWELLNSRFTVYENVSYDLITLVDEAAEQHKGVEKYELDIKSSELVSFVHLSTCFESAETYAGEKTRLQIAVRSAARANTPTITFSSLHINLDGLPDVHVVSSPSHDSSSGSQISEVALHETNPDDGEIIFIGNADLTFAPSQTRVFVLHLQLRETGKVTALTASLEIDRSSFCVKFIKDLRDPVEAFRWYTSRAKVGLVKHRKRWDAGQIEVLPKLPKLKIRLPRLRLAYYTSERAVIDVEMVNEEVEAISGDIEAWITGPAEHGTVVTWPDKPTKDSVAVHEGGIRRSLNHLAPGGSVKFSITIQFPSILPGEVSLEIEAPYHSEGDEQTTVSKTTSTKLNLVDAFFASFALTPLLHPDPWPSFFDSAAPGLKLRWRLQGILESQATEDVTIESIDLVLSKVLDGAECKVISKASEAASISLAETHERSFILDIQRESLDDARPSVVEGNLKVVWHRKGEAGTTESVIPSPRLNLPTSEPRALATRYKAKDDSSIQLVITLENPSLHYLSFETTLEPTDDFVLSGPTRCSTNLVPMSRHALEFTILPMVSGCYVRPFVKTVDTYFNKLLRIHPGEDLAADEAGNLLVWIPAMEGAE